MRLLDELSFALVVCDFYRSSFDLILKIMTRKGQKRVRIGSDEYTLELETRVKNLESFMESFESLIKEKDAKIAELEAQLNDKSSCTCNADSVVEAVPSKDRAEHDCLIIGDSIVDSLDPAVLNPNGGTRVVCVRGAVPSDISTAFKKEILDKTYKKVIVHVGSNLVPKFDVGYVISSVSECLLDIKRQAGAQCKVTFSSILPKMSDYYNGGIAFINDRIISAGMQGPPSVQWGFVESGFFFKDASWKVDPRLFKRDRIHLSPKGAEIFNNSVKHCFKS